MRRWSVSLITPKSSRLWRESRTHFILAVKFAVVISDTVASVKFRLSGQDIPTNPKSVSYIADTIASAAFIPKTPTGSYAILYYVDETLHQPALTPKAIWQGVITRDRRLVEIEELEACLIQQFPESDKTP